MGKFGKVTTRRPWSCLHDHCATGLKGVPNLPLPSLIQTLWTRAWLATPNPPTPPGTPFVWVQVWSHLTCSYFAVWPSAHGDGAESPGLRGTTGWELRDTEGQREGAVGLGGRACPVVPVEYSEQNPPMGNLPLPRAAFASVSHSRVLLWPNGTSLSRASLQGPAAPAALTQLGGHVISQTLTLPPSRWPGLTRPEHSPGAQIKFLCGPRVVVLLTTPSSVRRETQRAVCSGQQGLTAGVTRVAAPAPGGAPPSWEGLTPEPGLFLLTVRKTQSLVTPTIPLSLSLWKSQCYSVKKLKQQTSVEHGFQVSSTQCSLRITHQAPRATSKGPSVFLNSNEMYLLIHLNKSLYSSLSLRKACSKLSHVLTGYPEVHHGEPFS